ncbi:bifunctional 3-oxoadipate enol-lactonase/4-carboxymuconolactone decarboxylase PcaDC [Crenalkalicoccus roseus]|uniref:bifunctional 3-oxoadipate enol-lactonase/4-carboxymuconolactone decarboxylase PcaDC n=1 Tax=Crenalkalicoccus roseus TaxID=1485588 RepID=UPI00108015C8|nr:4-carboxymuconolactone decarboxylase [Crenalkalicoccus roseus]
MFCHVGDIVIHAQVEGPATAPAVLLLHSLGTTLHMWDPQAAALSRRFRVIRMDMRGHGLTDAPPGPYRMEQLVQDALGLLDALGVREAHVGGVSIGGRIAMGMAARAPSRVLSLMPCDTALEFQPAETWQERIAAVERGGIPAIAEATMGRWVLDQSLASSHGLRRMLLRTDPVGWLGCAAALRDCRKEEILGRIRCPTTIVVGDRDVSTPPSAAQAIHEAIPDSRLVTIAEAAHIPNFEREQAFTAAILAHMKLVTALPADTAEAGMAVRRQVLGAAHVERSDAAVTALDAPFRDFILEGVWGRVWTRPGLSHRDRSLLCLAMLAALGHHEELRLHVRATRNTGVTVEEMGEALLQVAAYAGVPAANAALRVAKDTLREMEDA